MFETLKLGIVAKINEEKFRRILTVSIGAPVLLMAACAISLVLITEHLSHAMTKGRYFLDILNASHECEKLLIDMETGERGFEMTGDSRFLDPYHLADSQLDEKFNTLAALVADNADQKEALKKIQIAVNQWRNLARGWIQAGKYDSSAQELEEALYGKTLMDSIRSQMDILFQEDEQLIEIQRSDIDMSRQAILISEVVTIGLVMLLTGFHLWRQMQKLAASYEDSLREVATQKEWFRVTLSSIGDAVIVTDANGHTKFMNAEAERMTGWPFREAQGKVLRSIFRIVNEESRLSVDDPVEKVFKEKRVVRLANHTLLLSKSGAEWPIEDSAAPIYDQDQALVGVVLVFHDATELRRATKILKTHARDLEQKVLARTVELQRTVDELEAFSYTVSHDLRAPLRAMQGYSNALLEDFSDKWGSEERDLLARIRKAAERLDILIQDLLTYSKVTKEHQSIEPVDLDRLIQDILTQYPSFQKPGLNFSVQQPLEKVMGHESGLTQVISNLLTNAVKFVRSDCQPKVKIWTEAKEFTVRLWIEDNGIGIDPENHARIFNMFEQVDAKKYDGTGMGLAIAKKAVENMQGSIGLESSLGNGTKMWIELLRVKNV